MKKIQQILTLGLFALLPWQIEYDFGTWKMNLPSEILIGCLGICLSFSLFARFDNFFKVVKSTSFVVCLLIFWAFWLLITALTSSQPLVSFKYIFVEIAHIWVFFGLAFFYPEQWKRGLKIFLFSLAGVVIYTLGHHYFYDFRADQSNLATSPFFKDHTIYSAVLVMAIGYLGSTSEGFKTLPRFAKWLLIPLFLTGIYFSYCRAAWLSIVFGGALVLIILYKWKAIFGILGTGLIAVFLLFLINIEKKEWQSETGNISIFSNDVSSVERLNRFSCAWRMALERPILGFGPGTYQYEYLPFQREAEMTRISVRKPEEALKRGKGGGAHSEYFQVLSEMGFMGLAAWFGLMFAAFRGVFLLFKQENRAMALCLCFVFFAFFFHGLVNNFLHDARMAMLFWGSLGWQFAINRYPKYV